ncbi:hypothetical protein AGR3A_Cc370063 [Agrobacterium tomkonis CFBP 6623]|uniref:Uncharacterized protein n=1 Tax=Agrobacterium tomkonis CFBP 6623 TaxID=1183432 RepID=A0A1S7Q045_9HYPH|nr:hypothetical protein AGR3A_Cc370063 [Agrobacterium tomkonis CFBP 6623]
MCRSDPRCLTTIQPQSWLDRPQGTLSRVVMLSASGRRHLNVAAMHFTPDQVFCKSIRIRSKHHALVYVPGNS